MKTLALLIAVSLLGGCAAYTRAFYGTGPASEDFVQCSKDNAGYAQIPDLGITWTSHMSKCMREAGWEQDPEKPAVPGWGPTGYRRIQQAGGRDR